MPNSPGGMFTRIFVFAVLVIPVLLFCAGYIVGVDLRGWVNRRLRG